MHKSLFSMSLVAALAAGTPRAHADVAISVGGQVSVSGSVGVALGWQPQVIVGGGVYAWGYGEFAEPPPPPPAEPCCCCEAPPPPPVYYAPPPAPMPPPEPSVVMVSQPRPRRIGLGARLSTTQLSSGADGPEADGVGGLLRLRGHRAELELEVGQDHFRYVDRVDTRVGGTVYLHLMGTRLRPYLLAGGGLNMIDDYYGRADTKQGYLEGGLGLLLRFGDAFSLNGDLRWSSRRVIGNDDDMTAYHEQPMPLAPDKERGFEGRIAGVFYF